ncbi:MULTISPECIES: helix-turn-helix domain-containing protein [Chryseobacterium]|uniref:AraC family transcriptional activator of pobA n=1 Tax=Chryseobacterium camelliae TaxID=1265445 RepID=A0ABU0TFS5_9FLAO|nr:MULTISPECIES: response regulator transcription factor [Chryseobacterium]MDT3406297.1 AraC family transcriptional activator of pobA [Pseudacidovorax intermedius]MDQ1095904.1 AraC family transcriptional activator of pobA [Chryseobacterium camelliae]MDQ1099841.1 AraC family transcriptional activator of pobA [Chryseobacterium sp. SORGH_AS_1048]MDR6087187.1 AraC family transcriptional activator of pobA [Chryseobacterium sp. SORGH_AS_0909]MDR6131560.1 AraC family transcriptional activator of pobA
MNIIHSLSAFHRLLSLPEPKHPLVSVINLSESIFLEDEVWKGFVNRFYCIALKRDATGKIKYGQQHYDYDKGVLSFTAPNQVQYLDVQHMDCGQGYLLVIHEDFLLKHPLAKTISGYGFFSYAVNEALHLSEDEENDLISILHKIDKECRHIDRHTQEIIASQIELLLNYSKRFYERQFITRKSHNHQLLVKFEKFLNDYFDEEKNMQSGLLTVQHAAESIGLSPNYLSDLLRIHTGQNTQQLIHEKLISKAKEKLCTTPLSVSEIAYMLGFEHAQSFSTLFKKKTKLAPLEFRAKFKFN